MIRVGKEHRFEIFHGWQCELITDLMQKNYLYSWYLFLVICLCTNKRLVTLLKNIPKHLFLETWFRKTLIFLTMCIIKCIDLLQRQADSLLQMEQTRR